MRVFFCSGRLRSSGVRSDSVVTIPFDYDESNSRQTVVPICIRRHDGDGNPIAWGWFEAVERVQEPLRNLARTWLGDVWRSSELAEGSVFSAWRTNGDRLGLGPSRTILTWARWLARDWKAGTWQQRKGIVTALEGLEGVQRQNILKDPGDHARECQWRLDYEQLSDDLKAAGQEDVSQMLDLVRDELSWEEIGGRFGKTPHAVRMKFKRWTTRLLS
jgi:hypothetical protein